MATKYYLDKSGLTYFWGKVKDKIESTEVDVVYIDVTKNFQANFNSFDKIYRNYVANKKTVIICTYNELATPGWLTYDSSTGKYTVSTNLYRYSNTAQYGISYDKWYTKLWVFTYDSVNDIIVYSKNSQVTYNVQTGGTGNYPLGVANTTSYTPTADYHPATKKYVDDSNEVTISSTEPTDNSEIWIDPNNIPSGQGSYISNNYGSSQTVGYSQEYINNSNSYSTSEIDTGQTWIDGKKIYRKVITINSLPNNQSVTYPVNINNIDMVTRLYGIGIGSTGHGFPLPFVGRFNGGRDDIELTYLSSGYIRIITESDRSGIKGYITIEYTKTS